MRGTVIERFGSLKRAFAAIQRITDAETWEAIARRRREDLLVYLALARFRKRPALSQLPLTLQRDMKAFFGTYTKACAEADALLFKAGRTRRDRRGLQALDGRQAAAGRPVCPPQRAGLAGADAAHLRGLRPGVPGRGRGGEHHQDSPPVGQALVSGLS